MPRFGIRSMLLGFVVIALWLSMFAGHPAASDVRLSIMLIIFLSAGFGAVFNRGRPQAFWAGFFVIFLFALCQPLRQLFPTSVPHIGFANQIAQALTPPPAGDGLRESEIHSAIYWTIWTAWMLSLAAVMGIIATWIYDRASRPKRPPK